MRGRQSVPLTPAEIEKWIDDISNIMKRVGHKPYPLHGREFEVIVSCHNCEKNFYVNNRSLMAEGRYVRSLAQADLMQYVCTRLEIMK